MPCASESGSWGSCGHMRTSASIYSYTALASINESRVQNTPLCYLHVCAWHALLSPSVAQYALHISLLTVTAIHTYSRTIQSAT